MRARGDGHGGSGSTARCRPRGVITNAVSSPSRHVLGADCAVRRERSMDRREHRWTRLSGIIAHSIEPGAADPHFGDGGAARAIAVELALAGAVSSGRNRVLQGGEIADLGNAETARVARPLSGGRAHRAGVGQRRRNARARLPGSGRCNLSRRIVGRVSAK